MLSARRAEGDNTMKIVLKYIIALTLGIALYATLATLTADSSLNLGYIPLAICAYNLGPISAALVGGIGHLALAYSYIPLDMCLANIFIGLVCGSLYKHNKYTELDNMLVTICAMILGILGIKTAFGYELFHIPFNIAIPRNLVYSVMNSTVMVLGVVIALFLHPLIKRTMK